MCVLVRRPSVQRAPTLPLARPPALPPARRSVHWPWRVETGVGLPSDEPGQAGWCGAGWCSAGRRGGEGGAGNGDPRPKDIGSVLGILAAVISGVKLLDEDDREGVRFLVLPGSASPLSAAPSAAPSSRLPAAAVARAPTPAPAFECSSSLGRGVPAPRGPPVRHGLLTKSTWLSSPRWRRSFSSHFPFLFIAARGTYRLREPRTRPDARRGAATCP